MTTATITSGKDSWVGSVRPNATHFSAPKLRVDSGEALAFVHLKSPVPPGDTVVSAVLRVTVAVGATGSFTFSAKRVASRVDWSDLTWNNKPGVTGAAATDAVTDPAEGDVLEFDVTTHVQAIVDGDPNYGWRIESDLTDAVKFYGFDSGDGATLDVEYYTRPAAPTDLVPAGIVSLVDPFLQASASDTTGEDEVAAVHVQVDSNASPTEDAEGTWTAPDFDSGTVASTVLELDLSTTAFAGLADAEVAYWHIRFQNPAGVWSDWSDTVQITRDAKSSLTIDNPPVGATVLEPTPPILATFAGTATAWRVRVVMADDNRLIWTESGKRAATDPNDIAWTPHKSEALNDGLMYKVIVDVWDDVDRVGSVGDPTYTRATREFTVADEVGVTAPTAVSVTQHATLPLAVVNFTRASAPDSFVIYRDGKVAEAEVDPSDVFVSGTSYAWTDPALRDPMSTHSYRVRAVVNGEQSAKSSAVTGSVVPSGLWLISQDRTLSCVLAGDGIDGWSRQDEVTLYKVHGREQLVQIRGSLGALGGSFAGDIYDHASRTVEDLADDLEEIRELDEWVTLVAADYGAKVRLRDVTVSPHSDTREGRVWKRASFSFIESDR